MLSVITLNTDNAGNIYASITAVGQSIVKIYTINTGELHAFQLTHWDVSHQRKSVEIYLTSFTSKYGNIKIIHNTKNLKSKYTIESMKDIKASQDTFLVPSVTHNLSSITSSLVSIFSSSRYIIQFWLNFIFGASIFKFGSVGNVKSQNWI